MLWKKYAWVRTIVTIVSIVLVIGSIITYLVIHVNAATQAKFDKLDKQWQVFISDLDETGDTETRKIFIVKTLEDREMPYLNIKQFDFVNKTIQSKLGCSCVRDDDVMQMLSKYLVIEDN